MHKTQRFVSRSRPLPEPCTLHSPAQETQPLTGRKLKRAQPRELKKYPLGFQKGKTYTYCVVFVRFWTLPYESSLTYEKEGKKR